MTTPNIDNDRFSFVLVGVWWGGCGRQKALLYGGEEKLVREEVGVKGSNDTPRASAAPKITCFVREFQHAETRHTVRWDMQYCVIEGYV